MAVVAIGVIGFFAAETLDELAIAPAAVLAVKAVAGMIFVLILITAVWRLEPVFSGRIVQLRMRTPRLSSHPARFHAI